jgi:hypothetical protein
MEAGETLVQALARKRKQFADHEAGVDTGAPIPKDNVVKFRPATKETISSASPILAEYLEKKEGNIKPENITYTERLPDPEDTSPFANKMKASVRKILDDFHDTPRDIGEGQNPFNGNPTSDIRLAYGTGHERIISNSSAIWKEGAEFPEAGMEHIAFFPKYVIEVFDKVSKKWEMMEEAYSDADALETFTRLKKFIVPSEKVDRRTRVRLEKLGYTAEDIEAMKPGERIDILKGKQVKGGEPIPSVQNLNKATPEEIYTLQRLGYSGKEIKGMKAAERQAAIDRVKNTPEPAPEELVAAEEAAKKIQEAAVARQQMKDTEGRPAPALTPEYEAAIEAEISKDLETIDSEPISKAADLIIKMQNHFDDATLDTLVENLPKSKEEISLDWKIALERRNMKIEAEKLAKGHGESAPVETAKVPETTKPAAKETRAELDARLKAIRRRKKDTSSIESEIEKFNKKLEEEGLGELKEEGEGELNFDDSRLNMMIPLDQAPAIVKGILKDIKATASGLFRNKELFEKTGYWLARDGKWRYEISDEGLRVHPGILDTAAANPPFGLAVPIYSVVNHPTLFEAVPEARSLQIRINRRLNAEGSYIPEAKLIDLKRPDKNIIVHELQHAVNDIVGSRFRGSNPEAEHRKAIISVLQHIMERAETQTLRDNAASLFVEVNQGKKIDIIRDAVQKLRKGSLTDNDLILVDNSLDKVLEQTAHERYMKDPGEMEARLSEKRREMTAEQKKAEPPWETLDTMLDSEGLGGGYGTTGPIEAGMKLYSGPFAPIYDMAKKLFSERKTITGAASNKIIAEVNGKKLTLKDDADFVDGFLNQMSRNMGAFLRTKIESPDFAYRDNEKMNPLIFNIHKKFFEGNFQASKRNETIRSAETLLSTIESKEKIKGIIEGKITDATPAELQAADLIRSELNAVRDKYKGHLREEYKKNLNEDENAALAEIMSGRPIDEVIAKYRTRIVPDKLGRRRTRSWLDEEVIRDIDKEYKEIDKWGLEDYMSHYERGPLRILSGGKLYAKAMSEADAARKFADLVELYPDKEFQLDTKHNLGDLATGLSKRSYNRLLYSLQEGLKQSIEGINNNAAKRLAQKGIQGRFFIKPTQSFSPYTMERSDFLQGEKNVFDILYNYMYSMEKKMALDPAIDDIRKAITKTEIVGTEEYTAKDGTTKVREIKRPYLKEDEVKYLERYIEDIKGKLYKGDELVDSIFKNAGNQRLYSRAIQVSRELEANLKLGYAPVKGLINAASGLGHIWTKTGTRFISEGATFLKTTEGKEFMKAMEPYLGVNIVESATGELSTRGTFEKWGWLKPPKTAGEKFVHKAIEPLSFFQAPELPVRKLTLAANYLMAKADGLGEVAARDAAIKANWFQQFTYDMASLPEIMRSPTGRLLMQFKPYLLKEMEFISTLRGLEIARYIGMQIAIGGPRGLVMIAKSLPLIGMYQGWNELEDYMNKEYPRTSRGIGGALGVDVSAAATFQFPSTTRDWLGPTLSDLVALKKGLVDPLIDGHGVEGVEFGKTGSTVFPITRHWSKMIEQVVDKDGWVKDERNRRLWHIDNMGTFVAKSVAGAEPIELNRIRTAERNLVEKNQLIADQKTETIDDVLDSIAKGKTLDPALIDKMMKLGIKPGTLRRAAQFRVLDPKQRRLLMTEVIRRPEILENYPDAADLE